MKEDNRLTTHRRSMEQIVHCCEEAASALNANEDPRHVRDDLRQAQMLIVHVLEIVNSMAKGAERA